MIGYIGAAFVLGIAAIGSAIGIGAAGNAAIGAWKRCYMNNKPAPFILTVFAGAPLTQTIYGFLLMQQLRDKLVAGTIEPAAGIAMAASAIAQGKAGASASDALGETGKGFSQYIMVVGLCETVALFAMVFSFLF